MKKFCTVLVMPIAAIFSISLFVGMVFFLELGRRIGVRRRRGDSKSDEGLGAVDSAVFALFGLLLAFTFSGAAARFDDRRHLIIEEANAIGTAWNMLELLPLEAQPDMKEMFRKYLDSRLLTYQKLPDIEAAKAELAVSLDIQKKIWDHCVSICEAKRDPSTKSLVLGAVNEMMNITTSRTAATRIHPPWEIFALLFALGLGCSLLAGYGMAGSKTRSWTHITVFAAVVGLCVYVILDIEYPRLGLINVSHADLVLIELRQSMQ